MKDTLNEGLPYITHFAVLHLYLRRPQILLTFIRQMIFRKKVSLFFGIEFELFHTFSAYSKLQWVFTLYVDSIIFCCNTSEYVFCVVTVVNCL